MRLDKITRTVNRARKRHALTVATLASADTPKARKRAERRAKAALRERREADRAAAALADWTIADA